MSASKRFFLAYLPCHHRGLVRRLEALAEQGWELEACDGWLTGRFRPTRRTELRYDAVPCHPFRRAEEAQELVRRREEALWQAVDTFWGVDLFRSQPCITPQDCPADVRSALKERFFREAILAALTLVLLLIRGGGILQSLTWRWYLSDGKAAALLLLPLIALSEVVTLVLQGTALLRRDAQPRPGAMALGALARLITVTGLVLLLVTLWVQRISRLWLRLALGALTLLAFPMARRLSGGVRQRRLMLCGGLLCAAVLVTTLAGWTVPGERYDIGPAAHPPLVEGETMGLQGRCTGWFEKREALLVRESACVEQWESGERLELTVYRCAPGMTELVWRELSEPENWHRKGNVIVSVQGSLNIPEEQLWAIVAQIP